MRRAKTVQYSFQFQVLIQSPIFRLIIVIFGIFQSIVAMRLIHIIRCKSVQKFNVIRVESDASITANFTLNLAYKGCDTIQSALALNSNKVLMPTSSEPFELDGFSVTIDISNYSDVSRERVSITIYGSNDDWTTAVLCGSLDVRWTASGIRFTPSLIPIRQNFSISFNPPLSWYSSVLLPRVFVAFGCLGSVCIAHLTSPLIAKAFCASIFSALCATIVFPAVSSFPLSPTPTPTSAIAAAALGASVFPLLAKFSGSNCVDLTTLLSALWLGAAIFGTCSAAGPEGCPAALLADPPDIQAAAACLLLVLLVSRVHFHLWAVRAADGDALSACRVWFQLQDAETVPLCRLDSVCRRVAARCPPPCYARQLSHGFSVGNPSPATGSESGASLLPGNFVADVAVTSVQRNLRAWGSIWRGGGGDAAGAMDPGHPVASLDRLYSQVSSSWESWDREVHAPSPSRVTRGPRGPARDNRRRN